MCIHTLDYYFNILHVVLHALDEDCVTAQSLDGSQSQHSNLEFVTNTIIMK